MKCEHVEVACTNGCKKVIIRSRLPHHLTTECKYRLEECELCKEPVKRMEMKVRLFIVHYALFNLAQLFVC